MVKKRNVKIKRWFKNNKKTVLLFGFVLILPLAIGGIYALPLPQIIAIDSGDLLAYYGTAFGIIVSFIVYRHEIKTKRKEKTQYLKPLFFVEVEPIDNTLGLFSVKINNHSEQPLSYLYFYDEFIEAHIQKQYLFRVAYNKTIEQTKTIKPEFNITIDSEIIDSDGYPKYIQILCDDKEGNMWNCCYYKVKDCEKIYYYPRDFEIM